MKQHVRTTMVCGLLAVTFTFGLSGCKQAEGDRCQLDSDCEDGLICCYRTGQSVKEGICLPSSRCDLEPIPDGGEDGAAQDSALEDAIQADTVQPDTSQPDTIQPDSVQPDSVQPDSVQPDTLQPDTSQPDTIQPDTVSPADASSAG